MAHRRRIQNSYLQSVHDRNLAARNKTKTGTGAGAGAGDPIQPFDLPPKPTVPFPTGPIGTFDGVPGDPNIGANGGNGVNPLDPPASNSTGGAGGGGSFANDTRTFPVAPLPPPVEPPARIPAPAPSPFNSLLFEAITRPQFGPQTTAEQNLINSLTDQTSGFNALRGLGAPTSEAVSVAIAPTLVAQRQQRIGNLLQSLGLDRQYNLGLRGQDVTQRGQDFSGLLTGRGQDITGRGQDFMGRGQDLNNVLGVLGLGVQQRGQDIGLLLAGLKNFYDNYGGPGING